MKRFLAIFLQAIRLWFVPSAWIVRPALGLVFLSFSLGASAQVLGKADSLHLAAINAMSANDLDEAIELEEKACSLYTLVKRKELMQVSLSALAAYHQQRALVGDADKALQYNQKALGLVGKRSEAYTRIANQLIMCYAQNGMTDKAKELSKNIFKKGKKAYGTNSLGYANILWNQAELMNRLGDADQSIEYGEEALSCYRENGDTVCVDYGKLLRYQASLYTSKEDFEKGLACLKEASRVLLETEGKNGSNYIGTTGDLSTIYSRLGNQEESNDIIFSNLANENAKDESATKQKAYTLAKQAEVFASSGNYSQAVSILSGAIDIFRQHKDSLGVGRTMYQLSNYYGHLGRVQKAKDMCEYAIKLISENEGQYSDLGIAYNSLAIFNHDLDNDSLALELSRKALGCFEAANDTSSTLYASILATAAVNYSAMKDYNTAIAYANRAVKVHKAQLGEGHPNTVMNIFNLACYYSKNKDVENASRFFHEALALQTAFVKNNFSHLTTNGRETYWNIKKYLFPFAPSFAFDDPNNKQMLIDAYESLLFSKGILLNSEIDFKNLLRTKANKKLIDKYNKLLELNAQIESLYNAAVPESTELAKKKQIEASVLEREIMRECKEFGDFTDNMSVSVGDVSQSLAKDEVAVEIVDVDAGDDTVFLAFYLRNGWDAPQIAYLFSSRDLKALEQNGSSFFRMLTTEAGQNYIYNNVRIGNMVWQPLITKWEKEEGEGFAPVRNVYFSPSSIFYQWGIEYLSVQCHTENAERICDKYNIHRVSSTKYLANRQPQVKMKSAAIFGNIDYDLESEGMAIMHDETLEELSMEEQEDFGEEGENEEYDLATRAAVGKGFVPLPATQKEASDIEYTLSANNVKVKSYTTMRATEEALKGLDGKAPNLLHIATHGFSYPEKTKGRRKLLSLLQGKNWTASEADNSLNFSGLVFAGANNKWQHGIMLPDSIDDGILTSKEIAQLNLSGLDLVVLSACQTGLGDIKDDGVFGLQRAFKKAGAHTMLMSLWEINDRATQIMMSAFYSALMQGMTRHDALSKAQEAVRQEGFADPHFWASFILLDGI